MRFSDAVRGLRGRQKTSRGVSFYSRYVNRPAGRYLAAAAQLVGLRPNHVTAISAAFSAAGIVLVATVRPSWPLGVGVAALLVFGFMLDSADGQLARLTGRSGPRGEWLDHVVDCMRSVALHSAVLISFYRFFALSDQVWYLVPLIFQLAAVALFVGGALAEMLLRVHDSPARSEERPSRLRATLLLPADFGIHALAFVALGGRTLFLAVYTALACWQVLLLVMLFGKWFRELGAVDRH